MITDHTWRPPHTGKSRKSGVYAERPCEYMNCRRHRTEHARATGVQR